MAKVPRISPSLVGRLVKKASSGRQKFRIAAFAFTEHGNLLGTAVNSVSAYVTLEKYRERCAAGKDCRYSGRHAERVLMEKFGKRIATILIVRIGNAGRIKPIEPCRMCGQIAKKLGIKVISIK